MGKVIALTGAAGYLGSVLLDQLKAEAWVERIIALDLNVVPADERVMSYGLDVRDSSALRRILAEHGVTNLVHAAFIVAQPPGMSLAEMRSINVEGSSSVIRCAVEQKVEHLTFVSSVSVYGYRPGNTQPLREDAPHYPNMIYGQHKAEVERFLREQSDAYPNLQVAVIRPTAMVGPRGKTRSPLKALTAQPVFVVSDGGHALTQALHEDDAAALITRVVEGNITGVFNAAPDDFASWAEIGRLGRLPVVSMPRAALNFATRFNTILPALRGFSHETVDLFSESLVVDNSAARQRVRWSPRYSTREAFAEFF